jgi:hypothetical protein
VSTIQQELDRLLRVLSVEREQLQQGTIPPSVLRRHKYLRTNLLRRVVAAVRQPLHESSRPELRTMRGSITTRRSWNDSYGDVYELWSEISVNSAPTASPDRASIGPEWLNLFEKLGQRVISGIANVYVVRFPTTREFLAPHVDVVVAVEALDREACLEARSTVVAPPSEPYKGGQPADHGIRS